MKKRLGRLIAAAVLLMLICQVAWAADIPYVTTTNAKANIRRSAASSATVIGRIPSGAVVEVTGKTGNFLLVQYEGMTGYVFKQYLNDPSEVADVLRDATATGYPYQTITNDQVNLRAGQSTASKRLASIPKGAAVTVSAESGSYAQVTYNSVTGWCLKKYVNMKTLVTPTATPAFSYPLVSAPDDSASYVTLQMGSTGSRVQALQEALTELGYYTGTVDGVFGAETQTAVLALQKKNDYPATGVVDQNLQAHIYSGKPKNAKGVKTDVKTLPPITGVNVTLNDRGQLVRDIQERLKDLQYYTGNITGEYDKATRTAVMAYQKAAGLKADGICGVETQAALLGTDAIPPAPTATPVPDAMTTLEPSFQIPTDVVKRGDKGESARLVQQRLAELGYLTGTVDGVFGSASEAALKRFQQRHGLQADGVAGADTYALLFSWNAVAASATATPAAMAQSSATVTPAPAATATMPPLTQDTVVVIREGVTGDAVRRLQERLTQLGYYAAAMDGVCKLDDVAAIRVFQRYNGLKEDGIAGYETQVKLYSLMAVTYGGDVAAGTTDALTTLRKGMSGDAVKAMQERLISLGFLTGVADGKYGTKTAEAVYAFQKANGLVRDSVAGEKTLAKLYARDAATATPAPTATPGAVMDPTIQFASGKTLRQGDVSDAVKSMQERLISLGYLTGKADGRFGAQTYAALRAFQQANHLDVDGIAGQMTLAALSSSQAVATGAAGATLAPTTTPVPGVSGNRVTAANVQYENWYSVIRDKARTYPYATVYDFETGLSWQVHMFSLGAHADSEPLTAADTAKMEQAFGGNTWNPKAVWVIFGNGEIFMASTHSMPHEVQHITDNNFPGHMCIHFPRTQAQVTAIGPYATSHQKEIDDGWVRTQDMIR